MEDNILKQIKDQTRELLLSIDESDNIKDIFMKIFQYKIKMELLKTQYLIIKTQPKKNKFNKGGIVKCNCKNNEIIKESKIHILSNEEIKERINDYRNGNINFICDKHNV